MITIDTAFELLCDSVEPLPRSKLQLERAVGRRLVENITADLDSPPHKKSVMDGYAIRSQDLAKGTHILSVVETVVAGSRPQRVVREGQATRIMTGAPVPDGADAVVMIEQTQPVSGGDQDAVSIELDSIAPGKHTMEPAANFASGDTVFNAGHRVRPGDIGLLAEVGAHQVTVGGAPTAAVLPTGDELVAIDRRPEYGQIRNSNGPMLLALAESLGLCTTNLGIGRDNQADLETAIRQGLEHDLFILSGGVSAGKLDLVPEILSNEGVEQVFHKVKIKPGKPIWFGVLNRDGRKRYVFGLPGNPVSSLVGFHLFVRTAIRSMEGDSNPRPKSVRALLSAPHETRGDRPTYWPCKRVDDDSCTRSVEPLVWHGSSDLLALGAADGLIHFPGESNMHEAGKEVAFFPLDG